MRRPADQEVLLRGVSPAGYASARRGAGCWREVRAGSVRQRAHVMHEAGRPGDSAWVLRAPLEPHGETEEARDQEQSGAGFGDQHEAEAVVTVFVEGVVFGTRIR